MDHCKGYLVKWNPIDEPDIKTLVKYYAGFYDWVERKREAFVFKNKTVAERFIQYDSKEYDFPVHYYEVVEK